MVSTRGAEQGLFQRDTCFLFTEAKCLLPGRQNGDVMKTLHYPLLCRLRMKSTFLALSLLCQSLDGVLLGKQELSCDWAASLEGVGHLPAGCVLADWGKGNPHRAQQSIYYHGCQVLPSVLPSLALQVALAAMFKGNVGQPYTWLPGDPGGNQATKLGWD